MTGFQMNIVKRVSTKATKVANLLLWNLNSKQNAVPTIKQVAATSDGAGSGTVFEVEGDCFINPFDGYVICDGHVIWKSMQPNYDAHLRVSDIGVPSFREYRSALRGDRPVLELPAALHCRHFFEWNYYHFFFDVLSKIKLFEDADCDMTQTLVFGKYVNQLAFAKQTLAETQFAGRPWICQDDTFIRCRKVTFGNVSAARDKVAGFIASHVGNDSNEPGNERIYLTRGKCTGRKVINEDDVIDVVKRYGFKVIDTNGMHISEQARIFRSTRYVIAPHGAGLTNILFRENLPLSVLELNPYHIKTDFQAICQSYGHFWSSMAGTTTSRDVQHANYTISARDLESKVTALLAT
jgi:capsular polysaccharide biosynthesis protein